MENKYIVPFSDVHVINNCNRVEPVLIVIYLKTFVVVNNIKTLRPYYYHVPGIIIRRGDTFYLPVPRTHFKFHNFQCNF